MHNAAKQPTVAGNPPPKSAALDRNPLTRSDLNTIAALIAEQIKDCLVKPQAERWLSMTEAAAYARVSRNTLRKWIDAGDVFANKRTGEWVVDRESIDDYFNAGRIGIK